MHNIYFLVSFFFPTICLPALNSWRVRSLPANPVVFWIPRTLLAHSKYSVKVREVNGWVRLEWVAVSWVESRVLNRREAAVCSFVPPHSQVGLNLALDLYQWNGRECWTKGIFFLFSFPFFLSPPLPFSPLLLCDSSLLESKLLPTRRGTNDTVLVHICAARRSSQALCWADATLAIQLT